MCVRVKGRGPVLASTRGMQSQCRLLHKDPPRNKKEPRTGKTLTPTGAVTGYCVAGRRCQERDLCLSKSGPLVFDAHAAGGRECHGQIVWL